GGGGTSSSPRGRREAFAHPSAKGAARPPAAPAERTPASRGGRLGFGPMRAEAIREANVPYHDLAAGQYDSKWGISYGEVGRAQVVGKLRKALGADERFGRGLEIGAGTGYFTLNLVRAGVLERAVATDISPRMLANLTSSAKRLGVEVKAVR